MLDKRASSVIVSPSEMRRSFNRFPFILETFLIIPDYSNTVPKYTKKKYCQAFFYFFYGMVILLDKPLPLFICFTPQSASFS